MQTLTEKVLNRAMKLDLITDVNMKGRVRLKLKRFYQKQTELDNKIDYDGDDRIQCKFLALRVELGELANEWRGFKFWSKNQEPSEELLEEYVDNFHFILSLGNELKHRPYEVFALNPKNYTTLDHFDVLFDTIEKVKKEQYEYWLYEVLLSLFLGLGEKLGFSENDIIQAYNEKNKVNHQRQAEGY